MHVDFRIGTDASIWICVDTWVPIHICIPYSINGDGLVATTMSTSKIQILVFDTIFQ